MTEQIHPKTILVLEDEIPLQQAIRIKLEKGGFLVVTARNVEQALNHLKDIEKIDVVWVDHYLLGEANGLDFVNTLKSDEKWKKIPIFVVSNTASEDKVKAYMALGVNKYFVKSDLRLETIIEEINHVLTEDKI